MPSQVQKSLTAILGNRALFAEEALGPYAKDESGLGPFPPEAVALIESVEEIQEVLLLSLKDKIPVTPRGLGSGRSGGALATRGGIVLSTECMKRVLEINTDDMLAVVEPGMITGDFQQLLERDHLFYPPDPASLDFCSLGGNVAENAGGPRAFKYGVTREYVLALEAVLVGGERLRTGHRTLKGVSGYDLVGVLTGSEGTLAVISAITLRVLALPTAVGTFVAGFNDVIAAGEAVAKLIRAGHRPRTLELMDERTVDYLRAKGHGTALPAGCALLLVELDGDPAAMDRELAACVSECERLGAVPIQVAATEAERRELWTMRRAASSALKDAHRYKFSEDVTVPRSKIPALLGRLRQTAQAAEIKVAAFGHAGDGNLHVSVLFDDAARLAHLDGILRTICQHALDLGGTLSGEHGIGLTKKSFMPLEHSAESLNLQRRLKAAFDPHQLLNPGKIFP